MTPTACESDFFSTLLERKAQIIFITASQVNKNGKKRRVLIESRPEFAIVRLNGIERAISNRIGADLRNRERHHSENLRLEARAEQPRKSSKRRTT
jgi:hypothetical protein